VDVGEDLPSVRPPVTEQPGLEVFRLERFLEEGVLLKVAES